MTRRTQHPTGPGNGPQKRSQRPPTSTPARRTARSSLASGAAAADATVRPNSRAERSRLTLAEVCAELEVSRSTFYEWRAKGRAPRCMKLPNGQLRVRRVDLDDWLDSRTEDDS